MNEQEIREKIEELEERKRQVQQQAQATFNFLEGKIEAYKELLGEESEEEN